MIATILGLAAGLAYALTLITAATLAWIVLGLACAAAQTGDHDGQDDAGLQLLSDVTPAPCSHRPGRHRPGPRRTWARELIPARGWL